MSYSNFKYSELKLNKNKMKANEKINVTVKIENKSNYAGYEVIQLYIQDLFGSVVRPIKELKDFKKEFFNPYETKYVKFNISIDSLKFWNNNLEYKAEKGKFKIYVGGNSKEVLEESFELM